MTSTWHASDEQNPASTDGMYGADGGERTATALRVLLVDDEAAYGASLHFMLKLIYGCDVIEVENSQDAYDMLCAGEAFDLIFMDVQLADDDGIDLCKRLESAGIRTPIVLMSAWPENGDRPRPANISFYDKPIDTATLDRIIGAHGGSRVQ